MLQQGVLGFKMERTEELITPRSGLALFGEVVRALEYRAGIWGGSTLRSYG